MTDKPKVTLTRQAAADMLRRHTLEGVSNAHNMINFYVEAGMLEVVEEEKKEPITLCGESVSWNWWLQQKPEFKAMWTELLYKAIKANS